MNRPRVHVGMRSLGDFQTAWDQMEKIHEGASALACQNLVSIYQTEATQLELVEESDAYWLYAETPDIRVDDIAVTVDDSGMLIFQGEQAAESCSGACDSLSRSYRVFTRRFMLKPPVQKEAIATMCIDGKLAVCIPKIAEQQIAQPAMSLG
jgi:HSP20 family molecular chaperone IbpA